jgi:hypothetical protein
MIKFLCHKEASSSFSRILPRAVLFVILNIFWCPVMIAGGRVLPDRFHKCRNELWGFVGLNGGESLFGRKKDKDL